jgi:hypothetical protein
MDKKATCVEFLGGGGEKEWIHGSNSICCVFEWVVDKVGEVTMAANQFLQWAGAWHGFRFGFSFLL